ncbi:MAG TPA: hypothetical protein VH643_31740 [Gemmataceae bacterium]|jgi:transcription initiation factor IIE alpha subunit
MDPIVLIILIVAVVLVLGVGVILFLRSRTQPDEGFAHFRCPKCRRRLRYQARQVGHKGKCSNCGGDVLFPPISQSIE